MLYDKSPLRSYINVMVNKSDVDKEIAWEAWKIIVTHATKSIFMKEWSDCLNHRGAFSGGKNAAS